MGRRTPRPVGSALQAAMAPIAPATPLAAVQGVWDDAVGERIAAEATPVSERDGVVTVACRSATWANELDLLGEQMLAKLGEQLPEGVAVTRLRFSANGEHFDSL
jgi:predicted nucleic acid-binding Zn ribbon protein